MPVALSVLVGMAHQPGRILPGGLNEITTRTFQGRDLFVSSKSLNQLIKVDLPIASRCLSRLSLWEVGV